MVSIAFTGDIAFSKYFADTWQRDDLIHPEIVRFLSSADSTVLNVEAPMTAGAIQSDRLLNHANPPQAVDWFLRLNGRIWNLANNHIYDCKEPGILDTLALAEQHGCRTLGVGRNAEEALRPVVIEQAGGIALLSVTYHNNKNFMRAGEKKPGCVLWDEDARIREAIRRAKAQYRWCVMVVHGGSEFSDMPLPFIRKRYHRYLKWGADAVIGHHPHVVQNYERVGGKTIFYSLGNFIFDTNYQRIQKHSEFGAVAKLNFTETEYTVEQLPILIDRETQRVVPCECPAVFRHIGAKEYRRVYPLMVSAFTKKSRRADVFLEEEHKNYTEWQWFKSSRDFQGLWPALWLVFGRVRYRLGWWKADDAALEAYIRE